jgi:hypothetical protein
MNYYKYRVTEEHLKAARKDPSSCNWYFFAVHYTLTEEFIREFKDYFVQKWGLVFTNQELSEEFIREFDEKVESWAELSFSMNLSEGFIRDYKDRVSWYWISKKQDLSEAFMLEFIDNIDVGGLRLNTKIPQEVKDKIIAMKELMNQ